MKDGGFLRFAFCKKERNSVRITFLLAQEEGYAARGKICANRSTLVQI